jgi:hypothetical protein
MTPQGQENARMLAFLDDPKHLGETVYVELTCARELGQ